MDVDVKRGSEFLHILFFLDEDSGPTLNPEAKRPLLPLRERSHAHLGRHEGHGLGVR